MGPIPLRNMENKGLGLYSNFISQPIAVLLCYSCILILFTC